MAAGAIAAVSWSSTRAANPFLIASAAVALTQ
jgi:hypothetical protein